MRQDNATIDTLIKEGKLIETLIGHKPNVIRYSKRKASNLNTQDANTAENKTQN